MNEDKAEYEREIAQRRRGQRPDTRIDAGGRVLKAMPATNRRQKRAYEKLMRSDTSKGKELRAAVKAQIEKKTTEVRQRIADGEPLESIREDLKRKT